MSDYKDTLNLPKTAFPMKASLNAREPKQLERWQALDIYHFLQQRNEGKPLYELHDGPPYANGNIHMGTALNKSVKDIINKSRLLSGFQVPYVPGWDCHGLPIELNVEKKIGRAGQKVDVATFRSKCREYAGKQVDLQREDFKRLGVFADWENPYLTMNPKYEANIIRALAKMIERGHLVRGEKPVYWSPLGHTAAAEAEVEYKEKTSQAIDVAFYADNADELASKFGAGDLHKVAVVIWTTTPWTLPANQAVAVNPELSYTLYKVTFKGDTIGLIVGSDLAKTVFEKYGLENIEELGETTGDQLEHILLRHPFLDRNVPIILGDHVTTDAGTGAVHTAPAHGEDDYYIGKKYGLPIETPLTSRSVFKEDEPVVGGLHVYKADQPVIEALEKHNTLIFHGEIVHSYPHCWRYKTPVIYRATPQWFISMTTEGLRDQAVKAAKETQWIPAVGENRFLAMIEHRPDWCISRQRVWGVPITLFIDKETGELHPNTLALIKQVADLVEQQGVEAWYSLEPKELLGDEADQYDKVNDILDVWFDSGVSHFCVLDQRDGLRVPADLYFEGSDQHRGWFQSSLLTSVAMRDAAPFKAVLTHGYVVDKDGRKMSKSLGNTIPPSDVINKYGADILRLWVASSNFTDDINISNEILKRVSDAYRRIRNTARFLLSNLFDFNPGKDQVEFKQLVELDRWAIELTRCAQAQIIEAYHAYDLPKIYQIILNFCTVDMGSFYLDVIKDRLYTVKADAVARRSCQTALYFVLEGFVRWLAPILSFTAEEIWQCMPGERSETIFMQEWFTEYAEAESDYEYWRWIMQLRDEVNKKLEALRNEKKIGSALDTKVILYADGDALKNITHLQDELRFALITSDACVKPLAEKTEHAQVCDIDSVLIEIQVTDAQKCERCWQRREDVGSDSVHPTLCGRCVENLNNGEKRQFA